MMNRHFCEPEDIEAEFEEAASKGQKRYGVRLLLPLSRLSGLLPEEFPEYGGFTHPIRLYGQQSAVREIHAQLCEELKRCGKPTTTNGRLTLKPSQSPPKTLSRVG